MSVVLTLDGFDAALRSIDDRLAVLERRVDGARTWFSVEQAADYLATSPKSIRHAVQNGRLTVHKSGNNRLLFHRQDLDRFAVAGDR
jgi:excisionase family DNA binding protein